MSAHPVELQAAWQGHVAADMARLDGLLGRYRERHRRYHTVDHLVWVIRHVGELADEEAVADRRPVVAAAFYHDAIYEPASTANERASARLARRDLGELGWDADPVDRVAAMIEATATHIDPPDLDSAVLFDADLAVLGATPPAYQEYVNRVRAEYRHLDDEAWRTGRTAVLGAFVARPSIYATAGGRRRWEHRARANLAAEIATLGG